MADRARECKPKKVFSVVKSNEMAFPGRPAGIRAPHGAEVFEISWPNQGTHRIPHEILRGYCPCAGCQGHSGAITFQSGNNLELRDVKPVGNYALGLTWGDAHESGIYSFAFLHRLGELHRNLGTHALIELGVLPPAGAGQQS